ncbi:MAG: AEC family transporter [Anaerovoracaceae bacterium]|nr:AEC family transporter [Anaerovoracaceae bacterium]
MLEVMKLAVTAVFPLMTLMVIGYVCRRVGFITQDIVNGTNRIVFRIFLPVLIFYNLYANDFRGFVDIRLIIYIPAAVIAVIILAAAIVPRVNRDRKQEPVIIQAIFRGNLVYVGMPVMEAVAGEKYLGLMALAITITIVVYNIMSVVVFEALRDEGKPDYAKMMKGIATNPLIHGAAAGIIFTLAGWEIPSMPLDIIKDMSAVATPLVLVLLGAGFSFSAGKKYTKQIFWTTATRLVIAPAVAIPVAILLGFNNYEIIVVFATMCAPTAVNTYTISQQMGGNDELAAQLVAYTSVCSIVTIFLWIIALQKYIPLL